jgi:hypothetical protein
VKDPVEQWIRALGGTKLLGWMKGGGRPLYLFGPPAVGKTLFQRAWHKARPSSPAVVTGNVENPKPADLSFFNAAGPHPELASCMRLRVVNRTSG